MRPFTQPTSPPLRIPKAIAAITPICGTRLMVIHPANAAVEPTERSKFPLAIARVIPKPTIATTLALVQTFRRLFRLKNVGVRKSNAAPTSRRVSPTGEKRKTAQTARLDTICDLHGFRLNCDPVGQTCCNFHYSLLCHLVSVQLSAGLPCNQYDASII